jgi:hypothetical protein
MNHSPDSHRVFAEEWDIFLPLTRSRVNISGLTPPLMDPQLGDPGASFRRGCAGPADGKEVGHFILFL